MSELASQTLPPAVGRAIARTRLRHRAWAALQGATDAGTAFALGAGTSLAGFKLGWIPIGAWDGVVTGLWAVTALLAILPQCRRWPSLGIARALDDTCELHSRLGTAVALATLAAPQGSFARAAIEDAAVWAAKAKPALAAPFLWPARLWGPPMGAALLAAAIYLPIFTASPSAHLPGSFALSAPQELKARVDEAKIEELKDIERDIAALRAALQEQGDTATDELLKAVEEMADALASGALTPEEALAQLDAHQGKLRDLQAELARQREALAEQVREAAQALRGDPSVRELQQALERGQFAEAADQLSRLARKAESKRDRDRLAAHLEALSRSLGSERSKEKDLNKEIDRLRKEIDRLAQQENEDRLRPRERDRLAEKRKQLERLERERDEARQADKPQGKQLQRLTKQMEQAAEELRRQQRSEQEEQELQEALKRAADEMRRLTEEQRKQQRLARSAQAMEELRDAIRRAGLGRGQRGQGQQAEGGAEGQGSQGAGGGGGEKSRRARLRDFLTRAGHSPGSGGSKDKRPVLLREGEGAGLGDLTMQAEGQGQGDRPGEASGGGPKGKGQAPGQERDPGPALGDPTQLGGEQRTEAVAGTKGKGPSLAETIRTSTQRGFASESWKQAHTDYSEIVEEDMDREALPAGYRRYVERYFDLIRPPGVE